jgi:ATP-dependent helicase/nuclease subunit A
VSARVIPHDLLAVQSAASDPRVSAWVAANAGSGKTHVLTQRVIRLLLEGVDPGKILCLTFTKAAAANMANRVFERLSEWTSLDDEALDRKLAEVTGAPPSAQRRALARRLFALALETPGGLKVQTIHAFCTRLLHQFPFEANVAARFTVLEDASESQLMEQLSLAVLLDAAAAPDSPLGRALAIAITSAADQTFKDVVREVIGERDVVTRWLTHAGGIEAATAELSRTLGVAPDETAASIEAQVFGGSLVAEAEWPAVAAALAEGSKNDQAQVARIAAVRAARADTRLDLYLEIFCTKELDPRENVVTKGIQRKHPALFQRLQAEQARVCALLQRRRAVACRDRTAALVLIASAVLERYAAEKARRGLLDYDDLIDKTLDLLSRVDAAWVHYKLDLGIDHVLIDEAQDTSPKQWDIVKRLVAEFTAGLGARDVRRTIFAVGDEKQSIFSFQGAEPLAFADTRQHFQRFHSGSEVSFKALEFKYSFRSGASVLGAVDAVFQARDVFASVTTDTDGVPPHAALPGKAPGLVEIWPLLRPEEKREIEGWDAPFDELTETSPPIRLAQRIAKAVKGWKDAGARAGDVLVLVRQRGALFEAIIRALKNERIEVAGADRMVLTEHIAVMDLMVLADALLLPDDDLALATVLKSPLFGFDDAQLFALAYDRKGPLRSVLRERCGEDLFFAQAAERLDRLAQAARVQTPFAFYADLLASRTGGRKSILERLGHEAADPLDEFLNLALDYERRETPSLQGFVAWLRAARAEVKRDMEIARDEVRVMTVHGAKGLEAPIVVLADTTTRPTGPRDPRLLTLPMGGAPDAPQRLIWASASKDDVGPMEDARKAARKAAQDEYRRLLYVAMTRAAERLVVCGCEGERRRPDGCWYDLINDALAADAVEEPADDGDGTVLRFRRGAPFVVPQPSSAATAEPESATAPAWLHHPVVAEPARLRIVSPSDALEHEDGAAGPGSRARGQALLRGRLAHRLLQILPEIAPGQRRERAAPWLSTQGLAPDTAQELLQQVLDVLDHPPLRPLFAPGSRAEVPIVGRLAGAPPIVVSGQVDRLAVTADAILIADFKTNRLVPGRPEDVPRDYVLQLALYRDVLARLYPDRAVHTALIWTQAPEIMTIPAAALDQALAAFR